MALAGASLLRYLEQNNTKGFVMPGHQKLATVKLNTSVSAASQCTDPDQGIDALLSGRLDEHDPNVQLLKRPATQSDSEANRLWFVMPDQGPRLIHTERRPLPMDVT
jgi:hypothetical protein